MKKIHPNFTSCICVDLWINGCQLLFKKAKKKRNCQINYVILMHLGGYLLFQSPLSSQNQWNQKSQLSCNVFSEGQIIVLVRLWNTFFISLQQNALLAGVSNNVKRTFYFIYGQLCMCVYFCKDLFMGLKLFFALGIFLLYYDTQSFVQNFHFSMFLAL